MTLNVLLFGPYAEAADRESVDVTLPAEAACTAGQVLESLAEQQPNLRGMLSAAVLAVNCQCVRPEHPVGEEDELAVIGLVSGG